MRDLNKNLVEKLKEKAAEAVRERPSLSKIEERKSCQPKFDLQITIPTLPLRLKEAL